jgi:hypothetical protein
MKAIYKYLVIPFPVFFKIKSKTIYFILPVRRPVLDTISDT